MPNKELLKHARAIHQSCHFPEHLTGRGQFWLCLECMIENPESSFLALTKQVYVYAAKKSNSTVGAVEKNIRTMIDYCYTYKPEEMQNILGDFTYPGKKRDRPTVGQVLYRVLALAEKEVIDNGTAEE